jgi:hypothetical protein
MAAEYAIFVLAGTSVVVYFMGGRGSAKQDRLSMDGGHNFSLGFTMLTMFLIIRYGSQS